MNGLGDTLPTNRLTTDKQLNREKVRLWVSGPAIAVSDNIPVASSRLLASGEYRIKSVELGEAGGGSILSNISLI